MTSTPPKPLSGQNRSQDVICIDDVDDLLNPEVKPAKQKEPPSEELSHDKFDFLFERDEFDGMGGMDLEERRDDLFNLDNNDEA